MFELSIFCTSFHVSKRLRLPAKKSFFALWLMSMKMGLLGSITKKVGKGSGTKLPIQWHLDSHLLLFNMYTSYIPPFHIGIYTYFSHPYTSNSNWVS